MRRRQFGWYEPAPKQPVPEDGLRVDRFGVTWWGRQWMEALDRLGRSYSNRLPRGRSYARAGRVVGLAIGAGEATAGVVGTRRDPYEVRLELRAFSPQQWEHAIAILAERARVTVALLRGELPPEIGETLDAAGSPLFPTDAADLRTTCSCPDWANPCKHVAAVHYVLAAALDTDPFLIFVLRGLGREALLAAVAEARGMAAPPAPRPDAVPDAAETLWEAPDTVDEEEFFGRGLARPQLSFQVERPAVELGGLARLGPPPAAVADLPKRLQPAIRAAARAAVALARQGSPEDDPSPARADDETVRHSVLDLVRGCPEGATMMLLRSRLPHDTTTLRRVVRALRNEGSLAAHGRGPATRYTLAHASHESGPAPRTAAPSARRGRTPTRRTRAKTDDAPLADRILGAFSSAFEALPLREIARRLEVPVDARLRAALARLRADGAVVMTGNRRSARYAAAGQRSRPTARRSRTSRRRR